MNATAWAATAAHHRLGTLTSSLSHGLVSGSLRGTQAVLVSLEASFPGQEGPLLFVPSYGLPSVHAPPLSLPLYEDACPSELGPHPYDLI